MRPRQRGKLASISAHTWVPILPVVPGMRQSAFLLVTSPRAHTWGTLLPFVPHALNFASTSVARTLANWAQDSGLAGDELLDPGEDLVAHAAKRFELPFWRICGWIFEAVV